MKASELRIGNFVNLYGDDCRIQTVGMWVHTQTTVDEAPIESVKPIPLNEEWLTKCANDEYGFYKQADGSYSLVDDCGDGTTCYLGNLRYVHQLQNLYFALTGEELTIKEKMGLNE